MRLTQFLVGLSFAAGLAVPCAALAQAKLVDSAPAANASVSAPRTVRLTFSGQIVPAASDLRLSMADGMAVSTSTSLSEDGKSLIARPTSPFMAGKWTLSWHATAADDGQKSQGSYSFTIK